LYRYPDAFPEPGEEDLAEAISLAEYLLAEIGKKLSATR
jgi:hypothetical protein